MLLPVEGSGIGEYYDHSKGRVRPKYAWYFGGLQNLVGIGSELAEMGDSLVVDLGRQNGRSVRPKRTVAP